MEVKVICSVGSFDFPHVHMDLTIICSTTSKRKLITLDLLFINCGDGRAACSMTCKPVFWNWNLYISQIVDLQSSIYCYFNRHVCDDMGTWALISLFLKAAIHLSKSLWHHNSVTTDKIGILTWRKSCKTVNEAKCVCVCVSQLQICAVCPYCLSAVLTMIWNCFSL